MSYTLSAARRRGQVGAHLPALRAICAPAAALPLRGDRLRARLAGRMGFFGAYALSGGSGLPFRYAAKRQGRDMFLLLDGCCPALGRGRLHGGRQGAGKAIINKVAVRNLQSFAIKTQHTFNIFFLLYCWLSKFTNFGIKILTIHGVWTISFQTKFNKFPYQKREIFLYFPRI